MNFLTRIFSLIFFFFFNDTATTEIYTLSLHDALPISQKPAHPGASSRAQFSCGSSERSEEHTSELQSPCNLVCRLLLEKKKKDHKNTTTTPKKNTQTITRTKNTNN